jgi:glycerophosphoryl diester phosphodiesterase
LNVITSTLGELGAADPEIATLDEALAAGARLSGINLELKPPIPVIESFLNRLMEACARWRGALLVSSFFVPFIEEVRTAWPDVETGILSGTSYDPDGRISLDSAAALDCGTVLPEHSSITPRLIEEAHDGGRRVITWTVNDPGRVGTFAEWGIDGVITDDIAMARSVVDPI